MTTPEMYKGKRSRIFCPVNRVAELWELIHHSFHIGSFPTIEKFTCDRSFSLSRNKKINSKRSMKKANNLECCGKQI